MKQKSNETRDLILHNAMQEFLEKGFRDASLRSIAGSLNGTTGIIYTYFKSKDELFATLVNPLVAQFEKRLATKVVPIEKDADGTESNPKIWFTQNLKFLIKMIEKYPEEMKLLFLKSEGSSFHHYKDDLIQKGACRSIAAFRMLKRSQAFEGQVLSDFFVLNLVKFVINIIVEILKQDMDTKELADYEEEMTAFLFGGWKALVDI